MTLSHSERGRLGGHKLQDSRTAEQRREGTRKARVTGAVRTIEREAIEAAARREVDRAPLLTPEIANTLIAALTPIARACVGHRGE